MKLSMWIQLTVVGLALATPSQVFAELLYVSSYTTNSIQTVTPGGMTSTFASGLAGPAGMAFDSAGNLYVANVTSNTIDEITPGGAVSVFASTGLSEPVGLAFDASGNLYVSNAAGSTINEFTPGGVGSVFASGIPYGYGLAFDSAGNLYVAEANNALIEKFTPGGVGSVFVTGLTKVTALAFDSSGNLFASGEGTTITEITPGGATSVFATVSAFNYALAFDSAGNLYVGNYNSGAITEFTPGGDSSVYATGFGEIGGMVFSPSSVPEPSSLLIMGCALGLIGAFLGLRGRDRWVGHVRQRLRKVRTTGLLVAAAVLSHGLATTASADLMTFDVDQSGSASGSLLAATGTVTLDTSLEVAGISEYLVDTSYGASLLIGTASVPEPSTIVMLLTALGEREPFRSHAGVPRNAHHSPRCSSSPCAGSNPEM